MSGFKAFLMRGNLISLAVAVVIGTAFTAVVTAIVADLITPLIAAIAGKPSFSSLKFTIHHSTFPYGLLINALLSFLIIAAVVYWLIVAPMVALTARLEKKKDATTKDCPECLSTIPIAARGACTARWISQRRQPRKHRRPPWHRQPPRRHRGAPAGTARALNEHDRGYAMPTENRDNRKVWARVGAWPSRAQTFCTAASVRPPWLIVWHCFLVRKLWHSCKPDNWLVATNTSVLAAVAAASGCAADG